MVRPLAVRQSDTMTPLELEFSPSPSPLSPLSLSLPLSAELGRLLIGDPGIPAATLELGKEIEFSSL
ncbi:hypothetical protein KC361_g287 [Hortaea werneckii]|nr:hypothetical protein KC361_g287 [Hortaea werneckii]